MWWASAVDAAPSTSARIVAPRASATSHSSRMRTAAPSAITKPSRSPAKGRETPRGDMAVMLVKPGHADGTVMAASVPPATTTSQRPMAIQPGGVAEGVGAGRARGADRLARALPAVAHRHRGARRRWASSSGRGTARPGGRPCSMRTVDLLLERVDAADAGGDQHADAAGSRSISPACSRAWRRPPARTA